MTANFSFATASPTAGNVESTPPPDRRYYRPELDALRLLAFLLVFILHFSPERLTLKHTYQRLMVQSGAFGMQLFFVLSAFLITVLLGREQTRTGTVKLRQFWIRRILRIWPLYFAVIFVVTVVGIGVKLALPDRLWLYYTFHVPPVYLLSLVTFWANVPFASGWPICHVLGPLWSISLEEHFYLAVSVIGKVCSRRTMTGFAICCIVASNLSIQLLVSKGTGLTPLWFNEAAQLQFFGGGVLLGLVIRNGVHYITKWARWAMLTCSAGLFCIAAEWLSHSQAQNLLSVTLGYAAINLACVLLICAVLGINSRLIPAPIRFLGTISFGLYVFHTPAITIVGEKLLSRYSPAAFAISLALTIAIASASFLLYERPFLRLKERFTVVQSRV